MKDIGNFTFLQFSPEPLPLSQLKTTSRDKEFLTGRITESSQTPDDTKVFQIASITKTFTAAALVKMTTNHKYRDYFNVDDPLATPIYQFSPLTGSSDELTNFQKYLATLAITHPNFSQITLRHLLNHTSGISALNNFNEFRADQTKSSHLADHYSRPQLSTDGFEAFHYCDANYNNLLAPIMESIASAANGRPTKFSEIVKEQIIEAEPLKLRQTFLFDEMEYNPITNLVGVKGRPKIKVAQGFDYFEGKLTSSQDFNYDSAAGGIYSSAAEVAKFYHSLLDVSLLGARGSEIFFDPKNFTPVGTDLYGLGINKTEHAGKEYFHHGGAGIGCYSYVVGHRDSSGVAVAATLSSYENLTRPLAAALLSNKKSREENGKEIFFTDEIITAKMNELSHQHSPSQLIAMRQDLEKLQGNFEEKAPAFQKIYAENYSDQTPSALVSSNHTNQLKNPQQLHK